MAKDPAFLFYYQDFFSGVSDLTNEEVGAYIRCLCVQASKGNISTKHINNICGTHDVYKSVIIKFVKEEDSDMMFNIRLREEIEKRKKYADSRRNNRKGKVNNTHDNHMLNTSKSYVRHMENENEDVNVNINDNTIKKVKPEKIDLETLIYPYNSIEYKSAFQDMVKARFKKKEQKQLQTMLDKVKGFSEEIGISIFNDNYINNWKGFIIKDSYIRAVQVKPPVESPMQKLLKIGGFGETVQQ